MKVLIVEDEQKILDLMVSGLESKGIEVESVSNGDEALEIALSNPFDAIVLDIMLPGRDGLSILKIMRSRNINTPVVLLTARGTLDDKMTGFAAGSDDYLVKPFYVDELIARLRAIGRRSVKDQLNLKKHDNLTLNMATREVHVGDVEIILTPREFTLLEFLMRSPERVSTRPQILEYVWGYGFHPSTNLVDVCIKRIRKKVMASTSEDIIETIRGVGYRLRRKSR